MEFRDFEAAASATPPSAPGTPSNGYATNGNPGTGAPATKPGAYWFHAIGEELRAVVVAAGITPLSSSVVQLLAALNAGWDMIKSHGSSGYQKLPGGLIIQWGAYSILTGGSPQTISLNMTFPTAQYFTIGGTQNASAIGGANNASTSTISVFSNTSGAGVAWISIGK